jgi:hypothetical protein
MEKTDAQARFPSEKTNDETGFVIECRDGSVDLIPGEVHRHGDILHDLVVAEPGYEPVGHVLGP